MSSYEVKRSGNFFFSVLLGTLYFLPTTFVIGQGAFLIPVLLSIIVYKPTFESRDSLIILFCALAALNSLLGVATGWLDLDNPLQSNGVFGGLVLLLTYLAAKTVNERALKVILIWIIVEVFAVLYELSIGQYYLFGAQISDLKTEFVQGLVDVDWLYNLRPYGLSANSSGPGLKVVIGIVLAMLIPMKKSWRGACFVILITGGVASFSRNGLIAIVVFIALMIARDIWRRGLNFRHVIWISAIAFLIAQFGFLIATQFVRVDVATAKELSSMFLTEFFNTRWHLWGDQFQRAVDNPIFGQFSSRTFLEGTNLLTHNSFLGLVSTHGFLISAVYILFIATRLYERPIRLFILTPIFSVSLFNDVIFWYSSLADIVLLFVLTSHKIVIFEAAKLKSQRPIRGSPAKTMHAESLGIRTA